MKYPVYYSATGSSYIYYRYWLPNLPCKTFHRTYEYLAVIPAVGAAYRYVYVKSTAGYVPVV